MTLGAVATHNRINGASVQRRGRSAWLFLLLFAALLMLTFGPLTDVVYAADAVADPAETDTEADLPGTQTEVGVEEVDPIDTADSNDEGAALSDTNAEQADAEQVDTEQAAADPAGPEDGEADSLQVETAIEVDTTLEDIVVSSDVSNEEDDQPAQTTPEVIAEPPLDTEQVEIPNEGSAPLAVDSPPAETTPDAGQAAGEAEDPEDTEESQAEADAEQASEEPEEPDAEQAADAEQADAEGALENQNTPEGAVDLLVEETPLAEPASPEQTTPVVSDEQPADDLDEPEDSDQSQDDSSLLDESPTSNLQPPDPYFYVRTYARHI